MIGWSMRSVGFEASSDWSLLQIFWRRRVTVIVCVLGAILIAGAYLLVTPTIYSATSHILVERLNPPGPTGRLSLSGDEGYVKRQCAMIKSTPIVVTALSKLDRP